VAPKIILDSNFLLVPSQFKLDIFEEIMNILNQNYEPIALSTTIDELRSIAERGAPKLQKQAEMALKFAEKCDLINVDRKHGETNDDVIIRMAKQMKCLVATNDSELRKRLRNISIPVVYVRQKSRLELEGSL
jgi:rRNA-processing protein FCF1